MREVGIAALAMTEVGDAAPAMTGAGGAPHPLLAVAAPPPLTGTLYLTITSCFMATVYMHSSWICFCLGWTRNLRWMDYVHTFIMSRICQIAIPMIMPWRWHKHCINLVWRAWLSHYSSCVSPHNTQLAFALEGTDRLIVLSLRHLMH